ncbi:uncharacterized protein Dmoj_GI12676 [Drosophila mojavensis]|uniref:Protein arginine N-methyltransferase 6 n=1 Tax=Drosophila mojavensis TaxID=7230 RepID=B4KW65_DROMO|nr:uncharacterized protein Dmoj_GI12676 [Drosophila mojavensis]
MSAHHNKATTCGKSDASRRKQKPISLSAFHAQLEKAQSKANKNKASSSPATASPPAPISALAGPPALTAVPASNATVKTDKESNVKSLSNGYHKINKIPIGNSTTKSKAVTADSLRGARRGLCYSSQRVRSCPRLPTPTRDVPHELQTVDRMTSSDFRHDFAAHLENMRTWQKNQDHMRFFQLAMHENRHLFAGKTILNLTCGTGTLALMAARAGAKTVFAVDHSQVTDYARLVVKANKMQHIVKMLSVQSAGCAGMERLGVPTRTSLSTPPDDRDQFRCRMRVDALQARELLAVRGETVIRSNSSNIGSSSSGGSGSNNQQQQQLHNNKQQHSHHQQHYQQHGSSSSSNNNNSGHSINNFVARGGIEATTLKYGNTGSSGSGSGSGSSGSYKSEQSNASTCSSLNSHSADHHQHYQYQLQQQQTPRCPHHVPLPDSEYGQDRHLQLRSSYQQSEITRSYTKPPPNKTVRDVPEHICAGNSSYRLATAAATTAAAAGSAGAATAAASAATKSKPNAITKFFSRISSPKSPTSLATTSSTSSASMSSSASSLASSAGMPACVSPSSSASSLAAAPLTALPTLKSTACSTGGATFSLAPDQAAQQQQQDETTQ